ncbi:MAG: histidine kinase [Bacteroidetes bacterium]|nr:histidine kinase [Bacteroidota bacterium]
MNRYDPKTNKFITFKHIPNNHQSLSSNRVFGIFEDSEGVLWIGTMGGGLNRFDRKTGLFKHYTEKDGLANNMVYCILEDNAGNLWMTTNNGISKFNVKTETFVNYDIKDGVQSSEFNQNAALKTKNGLFFLGGMNGFNAFDPLKIVQNHFVPPVVITSFKKFNEVQKNEIDNNDTIFLEYNENFFSFEFSSLDFSNPIKNSFAYKLENFDKDWIFCDANRRFAEYTKVSPGIYVFHVKGTNSDGLWNKKGMSVVVIISPPWWATWSFRISFSLFLIFILWYVIRLRFMQIRKKHEIEKKVLEIEKQLFDLEQKSLRLQMNPHFIFNSLNSIQSFIVNNDSDKAIHYLAKFAQLMRLILSNSSEPFVPIKDELKALTYYMEIENLRFGNKFEYSIKIDPEIDDDFIGIPPMVIQPYVENAILHGIIHKKGKGKISISFTMQDESLICHVEDDGVGREKSAELKANSGLKHKSKGMIITKERLEILNKQVKGRISVNVMDLKNKDGFPVGTKVEIIIPFKEI